MESRSLTMQNYPQNGVVMEYKRFWKDFKMFWVKSGRWWRGVFIWMLLLITYFLLQEKIMRALVLIKAELDILPFFKVAREFDNFSDSARHFVLRGSCCCRFVIFSG